MLKDISKRQSLSEKYLSKLVIPLKGAGLINSERGAYGGYMLSKEPGEISLKEIVEVSEGSLSIVDCVGNNKVCNRTSFCPARTVWCKLSDQISGFLQEITLENLVDDYKEHSAEGMYTYHI